MKICILLIMMLGAQPPDSITVAFWNLENYFDPFVDSTKSYNEYTENGSQHWTKSRFYKKRNNLYKAILAFSHNTPIGIMGVCEVENEFCLHALFAQTPLKKHNYRWVTVSNSFTARPFLTATRKIPKPFRVTYSMQNSLITKAIPSIVLSTIGHRNTEGSWKP